MNRNRIEILLLKLETFWIRNLSTYMGLKQMEARYLIIILDYQFHQLLSFQGVKFLSRKLFLKALFSDQHKASNSPTRRLNLYENILELKMTHHWSKSQILRHLLKFWRLFKHKQTIWAFLMKPINQVIRPKILFLIRNVDLEVFQNRSQSRFLRMLQVNFQEGHEALVRDLRDKSQKQSHT